MPVATIRRLQKALSNDAEIYTPYGATECLPVASVSGSELNTEVERRTAAGEGTCIGRPVAPNGIKIIPVTDNALGSFAQTVELPVGITGEIVVHGPTSTDSYWQRPEQTGLAKVVDTDGRIWHRMGDAGDFDPEGRLWYCGRKSQRVVNQQTTMYADQVEAIFNVHPEVARTALVGIGPRTHQTPVLCVELSSRVSRHRQGRIKTDLLQLARNNVMTKSIRQILFHKSFPVDIRHNAKIGREKLAVWAEKKLS